MGVSNITSVVVNSQLVEINEHCKHLDKRNDQNLNFNDTQKKNLLREQIRWLSGYDQRSEGSWFLPVLYLWL